MNSSIERLLKFFTLEVERDFDNRAVLGGLDQMLAPWKEDAKSSGVSDEMIEVVTSRLRDYPKLSALSRKDVLQGVWNRVRKAYPDVPPFPGSGNEQVEQTAEEPPVQEPPVQEPTVKQEAPVNQQVQDRVPKESVQLEKLSLETTEEAEVQEVQESKEVQSDVKSEKKDSTPPANPIALSAPLTTLSGVGPKTAKTLEKLELYDLGDLLYHFPRRYDDYSQLKPINRLWYGEEVTVIGIVDRISVRPIRKGKTKLIEAFISDGTGTLKVTWFNQIWITKRVQPGRGVVLSGKIDQYLGKLVMNNPEWELLEQKNLHTNRIVPVYPLTSGITGKWLRRIVHSVVTHMAPRVPDPIPQEVLEAANLDPLNLALQQIHFPDSAETLKKAQQRLAFDEMFFLQLGVLQQKSVWEQLETTPIPVPDDWIDSFVSQLPYKLTNAQSTALNDVSKDLASSKPMNRLLQGDVGSGKTTIAAAAIARTAASGAQAAFMAPTSILAEQHYLTLQDLMPKVGVQVDSIKLLTGATPESERREIHEGLENGSVSVLIGTHALIEAPVIFNELALAVIDEQHRFGVHQRALLRAKGNNPNLLVMTATPIPRSLSLTIYGDLDLSIIDELPPGRQDIETRVLSPRESTRAYNFINSQVEKGHQAFIIYPLVEESEKVSSKAAVDQFETLQEKIFPALNLGLLHGRMKPDEKESVMRAFREGVHDVLVSTSVIEVGVDIPNATVMVIEGANHFGLAQLHQFRGRVGRGEAKSYCLLIPDSEDDVANERLNALESTNDGFQLAEMDLKQRGPGDFLGTRQSGFAELLLANLTDIQLIEKARRQALGVFEKDPNLDLPEHKLLAEKVQQLWSYGRGEIS